MRREPRFLGVGAQKSGTTWLHNMLEQHPGVFVPRRKEIMFFDVESNWEKGSEWYIEQFSDAVEGQLCGEVTPGYLWVCPKHADCDQEMEFRKDAPARVRDTLGKDVKFLVLLRNPIDRAISAYMHHVKKKRLSFDMPAREALHRSGILHMGLYSLHLKRWFEVFERSNFHIWSFESMLENKQAYLRSVARFLGIAEFPEGLEDLRVQYKYDYSRDDRGVLATVDGNEFRPMDDLDIDYMRGYFRDDVNRLKEMSCLSEDGWSQDFL